MQPFHPALNRRYKWMDGWMFELFIDAQPKKGI